MNQAKTADSQAFTLLQNALHALWRSRQTVYVLCDPFASDPLAEIAEKSGLELPKFALRDPLFENVPELAPYIASLNYGDAEHLELMDALLHMALAQAQQNRTRSVCCWLFSEASLPTLHAALLHNLDVEYADGRRIYLRYFDPRVWPRLHEILQEEQRRQLFGPVRQWCHLGRNGELLSYSCPPPATQALDAENGEILRLDSMQAAAVERIEAINRVAARLHALGSRPGHAKDVTIDAALNTAHRHGLNDVDDRIAYAWRVLHFGHAFLNSANLEASIRQCIDSGAPLEDVLTQED